MRAISKRQKEILKLINESIDYISSKELAGKLEVSTRTIRNDISEINSINKEQVISLLKSKGYYINNFSLTKKILEDFNGQVPNTVEERSSYIINKLLYRMDSIDIFDLADELMVSEYTIEKDIVRIKSLFKDENSNIEMKRINNKIYLTGSEKEKRNLLCRLILKEQKDNVFDIESYEKNFRNIDIKKINSIIRNYFLENNIKINDLAIINLVVHILIVMEKVINKYDFKDDYNYSEILNNDDINISFEICRRIEQSTKVTIPENEKKYIALLISGKRIFIHSKSGHVNISDESNKANWFVNYIINKLYEEYFLNFKLDKDFITGFTLHIENLLIRSSKGVFIQNPLIYTIKKVYPLIYDMGVSIALEYEKIYGYSLNDDEIGLIVLHLASSIEKLNENNYKIKCLIVCPTGVSSSNLLKNRLLKVYSDKIDVIGCLSAHELDKIKEKSVDLIISTVPINKTMDIKIIECSPFILADDIKKLNNILSSFNSKDKFNELYEIFDEKLFLKDIDIDDKMEVIDYLTNKLYEEGYCPKDYVKYVISREKVSSTAYGGLIAIPHPLEKIAFKNKIEIGILRNPIVWGEYKVQIVFLFCLNGKEKINLDAFFEKLIILVENQDIIKRILSVKSYSEFIKVFGEIN